MGILEQVTQLKNQGISESEITIKLQEQGVSPKEINDTFNQLKIKHAVSNNPIGQEMESSIMEQPPTPPKPSYTQNNVKTKEYGEEDLYVPQPPKEEPMQEPTPPKIQEFPDQETYDPTRQQQPPQMQEFYPQEGYGDYVESSSTTNTDTMLQISEQVFSEKIKKFQKQLNDTREFKALAQVKLENISSRLKRIETSFDQLQIEILQKIGSYGKNLETNRKEMDMMQNSFRKMVNPLADNAARKKPKSHKKTVKPKRKISKKRK